MEQKIRLNLNVIAPDNFEKKFNELRGYMFGGFKSSEECEDEGLDYNEDEHKLHEENLNNHILEVVVENIFENIFRKASIEKEYVFYGQLCERLIKLELRLRGLNFKRTDLKNSAFRKTMISVCRDCFEKFTDQAEKERQCKDFESELKFQDKLFGNLDFVGELFRRELLQKTAIYMIFQELLGINGEDIDDLKVEGAVKLMNKIGQAYDTKRGKGKSEEKAEERQNVFNRFAELIEDSETRIENRVKILIKNMFSNRDSGWKKTEKKNEGGPKTKEEVRDEMQR